jgi:hypothetical protein
MVSKLGKKFNILHLNNKYMQKLTTEELMQRIMGLWEQDINFPAQAMECVANVIGGTVIWEHHEDLRGGEEPEPVIYFGIIRGPEFEIDSEQLCQIFDEGNHCLSKGSIVYEDRYAYITWSNLGHI